jgi:hypothetical protein
VGHSGGNGYFAAWLERYPDDNAVVVVLANDTRPGIGQVRGRVAEILFAGGR